MLKLRDWININKLNWYGLSFNPNAIELLKENKNKINWDYLSLNENAIKLLKENQVMDRIFLAKITPIF